MSRRKSAAHSKFTTLINFDDVDPYPDWREDKDYKDPVNLQIGQLAQWSSYWHGKNHVTDLYLHSRSWLPMKNCAGHRKHCVGILAYAFICPPHWETEDLELVSGFC